MSPEIVSKKAYDGKAADIWALGVVMYVMFTGTFPFKRNKGRGLYNCI